MRRYRYSSFCFKFKKGSLILENNDKNTLTIRDKMKLILDTGQMMMESGAGSKRIVRDMLQTAAYLGIYWEDVQIHITYSTIMINVDDGKKTHTMFRKCYRHGVNMLTFLQTSKTSREALYENEPYGVFVNRLHKIREHCTNRIYPEWLAILAIGLASSAFCLIFGGHEVEALYTMLAAITGALVKYACTRIEFNGYVTIAASAFAATITAYLTMYLPGAISPFLPIVACALTLIPGVPLINAVDDFLNNYLTSGMTRMTHTLLIMLAMTFGIAGAVGLTHVPSFTAVNIAPEYLYLAQALAAAMAALGFSVMFNIPKRYIPLACLGAIITVDVRDVFMVVFHFGMASSSFFGAAVLSVLYFSISKYFHAPVFVVTIPAIIPLVPGVLMYRFFFAIIDIQHMDGMALLLALQTGVEAMLVLLGISLGATLPDVLAHQYIERGKRKKLQKLLMKRDGNREEAKAAADLDKASGRG